MKTPYPFKKESKLFAEAILNLAYDAHRKKIAQYVSEENMQSFCHGRGWATVKEDKIEDSQFKEVGVELKIDYPSILNNEIQKFFDFINDFIEGFTSQMVRDMFQTIGDACQETGNIVKQSDKKSNPEAFLEMLNKVEFSINEEGQVVLPQIHLAPENADNFITELNQQGPEFLAEVERVKKEKADLAIMNEKARLSKFKAINL